jgi:F0F1-type ATP synthase assembly protein I
VLVVKFITTRFLIACVKLSLRNEMQSQSQKPSSTITFRTAFPPSIIILMLVQIALIVGSLVTGAVYLGRFLDGLWATKPWLSVVLFLIATFISLPIIYRVGMRAIAKMEKADVALKAKTEETETQNTTLNELPVVV